MGRGVQLVLVVLVLMVACGGWLCKASLPTVVVDDKTSLAQGHEAYLLFYQKLERPYPNYVTVFDFRVLSGNQATDIFSSNSTLLITSGQGNENGVYVYFGTVPLAANEAGNYSLVFTEPNEFRFVSYESTAEPGTIEVRLAQNLPNEYGPYSLFLERSMPGGSRLVVPTQLVSQPVGETILVVLSPVQWYLSVATTLNDFKPGMSVPHEMLPGNEVAVQEGDIATVTGNLQSGFVITIGYNGL